MFYFRFHLILIALSSALISSAQNYLDIPISRVFHDYTLACQAPDSVYLLNLRGKELKMLPPKLSQFKHLQTFSIMKNDIRALNADIYKCSNLVEFVLRYNHISRFSDSLARLKKLEVLNAKKNDFTSFPSIVLALPSLVHLDLAVNQIQGTIPSWEGRHQLGVLDLHDNRISGLPASWKGLERLRFLDLASNDIEFIPDVKEGDLPALTELNLSENDLDKLPSSIGHLKNLTTLVLTKNEFKSLPKELAQLDSLSLLILSYNPLSSFDFSQEDLPNLRTLVLVGTRIPVEMQVAIRERFPQATVRFE